MSESQWAAVDEYLTDLLIGADEPLERALRESSAAGLPPIAVSPQQGRLLELLARVAGARRILELGTLGGYSTIWLARALPPDGFLLTLELDAGYASVAAANIEGAGLAGLVEIRTGPALASLEALRDAGEDPFDMVFIDADKRSTPDYFRLALELTRPGGMIVADNVIRGGAVADPDTEDPGAQGMRRFLEMLAAEPRVSATTIQTVGSKGYDGFTLALLDVARAEE
jgi:predicted O-methyltransferase YrrM